MIILIMTCVYASQVEMQCLEIINQYRKRVGARPLRMVPELNKAARIQSQYQMKTQQCTHSGPPGNSDFMTRMRNCGYNGTTGSENVAQDNGENPNSVFNLWKGSIGHHRSMVSDVYTDTGLSCVMGNDGRSWWTNVFGAGGSSSGGSGSKYNSVNNNQAEKGSPQNNSQYAGSSRDTQGEDESGDSDEIDRKNYYNLRDLYRQYMYRQQMLQRYFEQKRMEAWRNYERIMQSRRNRLQRSSRRPYYR